MAIARAGRTLLSVAFDFEFGFDLDFDPDSVRTPNSDVIPNRAESPVRNPLFLPGTSSSTAHRGFAPEGRRDNSPALQRWETQEKKDKSRRDDRGSHANRL
jgi:hypothetical protein